MIALLLATLISDPHLNQVLVEGRSADTHIELKFRGKPTFQTFRSHDPNVLVVDVIGAALPAGFPDKLEIIEGAELAMENHVGHRTRLMRIRLALPDRLEPRLEPSTRGIRLILPLGSSVAKVISPGGVESAEGEQILVRLRQRLERLEASNKERKDSLTQKEEALEAMSRQLADAMAKNTELSQALSKKEATVANARAEAAKATSKAEAALAAVRATEAKVRGQVAALDRERASQSQKTASSEAEVEARRSEIDKLLQRQVALKTELAVLQRAAEKQKREAERLVQAEVGLRADVETADRHLESKSATLKTINTKIRQGEISVASLRKARARQRQTQHKLEGRIAKAEKALTDLGRARLDAEAAVKALAAKVESRRKAYDVLSGQTAELSTEVVTLRKAVEAHGLASTKLGRSLRASRKALKAKRRELASLRREAKAAGDRSDTTKARIAKAEAESKAMGKQAKAWAERLDQRRVEAARVAEQLKVARSRGSELVAKLDRAKAAAQAADAEVAAASAELAQANRSEKQHRDQIARLERQRRAQDRYAKALAGKAAAKRSALADGGQTAAPVVVAKLVEKGPARQVSDASPGFGGGPKAQTGRLERLGYRPVGPERVLVRFGGNSEPSLRKVSATLTTALLPGITAAKSRLRTLDTSLFGGLVQGVRPRLTRKGLLVELKHEAGVEFRAVSTAAGVELRVK